MAAADPGDPAPEPNPAGLLLGHMVASGTVAQWPYMPDQACQTRGPQRIFLQPSQYNADDCHVISLELTCLVCATGNISLLENKKNRFICVCLLICAVIQCLEILDISKKSTPCFVNFSRLQQITNIQAEINQKNLEIELLKLEKDTADIVHPSFLAQKCQTLQSMNNHLEAVLKEKRSLRQRLLKPMCQENLPIEAVYHRYMVHLLELAVTFIERLETHLETIRNIPHLDADLKRMSKALAKMDILVTETEELAENILKWREQQKEISSCIPKILAEENYLHKCIVTP